MECSRCLLTSDVTNVENGYCDFCRMHDELEKLRPEGLEKILAKVRKQKGYQVLIGISGGFDSAYLLWYTVHVLKLKPLVLHFDNGWNYPFAERNMMNLVYKLGVGLVRVYKDEYYDKLCGALLLAGVKDADIANDMYMADIMQTTARKYKIKYVFNGHDYRTEGSTPIKWSYMDAKYIQSVYKWAYDEPLKTQHLQTFWKQIKSGIKQIRVFHYTEVPQILKAAVLTELGFEDYPVKHGENIYTKWVGYWLLPVKWGIDKRKVYLSAQIRSNYLSKEQALKKLQEPVDFENEYIEQIEKTVGVTIAQALNAEKHTYKDFDYYNFKRFKPLIWVMMKLKLVPYTFYKKYTQ
jgi:hypothetical protein